MATTTRGVLWEVLAPVIRWPMYSPLRMGLVTVAIFGALLVVGELAGADDDAAAPPPSRSSAVPSDPSTVGPDPGETVDLKTRGSLRRLAREFVAAYIATDQPRRQWLTRLRALSTKELGRDLATVDPTRVQIGRRVTEVEIRGVSSTAGSAVVHTARGEATVDMAFSGTRWEVTRIVPEAPDTGQIV